MIIKPIIPIWLMIILCGIMLAIVILNSKVIHINNSKKYEKNGEKQTERSKNLIKQYVINLIIKILIIILLFLINLRFMVPNGEVKKNNVDADVLFIVDKTVSMTALDYNGNNPRFDAAIEDCCYIVDELTGSRFSIITFGDTAQSLIPYTTDASMVKTQLKTIITEEKYYAKGSSINIVKDELKESIKKEYEKRSKNTQFIIFFVTDGEITVENEKLDSFSEFGEYVSNGAVLGYGTTSGGKMINDLYANEIDSPYYYVYYYDENYNRTTALSKLDENNLKSLANDLKIDYIQMNKQKNVDYKLNDIKKKLVSIEKNEKDMKVYNDIYFYFAIPLIIVLFVDFINKKRRIQ